MMSAALTIVTRKLEVRRRGQQGYTLIEVLLVVAISSMLLGPLFAWMIIAMRQQPVERDGMVISAQAGILRGHFPRDVAVAGAARVYPVADEPDSEWATWREACVGSSATGGAGVRHLAVLISQGESRTKTIYSVAPTRDASGAILSGHSIWRTQCSSNDGALVEQKQLMENVANAEDATFASCRPDTPTAPEQACRQVSLTVTPMDSNGQAATPVELNTTRRTDLASLLTRDQTNFLPVARIKVISQAFVHDHTSETTVVLSAADSRDPDGAADGSDLTYQWELPTGPEGSGAPVDTSLTDREVTWTLPSIGDYTVRLTVTDADGARNVSYRRLGVQNRSPVIGADWSISPSVVTAGIDTITMDAGATHDPDGEIASYQWRITGVDPAGEGLEVTYDTPDAQYPVPEWMIGDLIVELTVTDAYGAVASRSQLIEVIDPAAPDPDPGDPGDPDPGDPGDPDPGDPEPGAPVAVFTHVINGTTVSFDSGGSQPDGLSYAWDFGLLAGPGATTANPVHTYPGPGTYRAALTVTGAGGATARHAVDVVIPGTMPTPGMPRIEDGYLVWNPVPGARRYLVDMVATTNGCSRAINGLAVAASAAPKRALPPNPCTGQNAVITLRVGVEGAAGGNVAWSPDLVITLPNGGQLPGGEVVK